MVRLLWQAWTFNFYLQLAPTDIQCMTTVTYRTSKLTSNGVITGCYRQEAERLPFIGDLEPILALQQGDCCLVILPARHALVGAAGRLLFCNILWPHTSRPSCIAQTKSGACPFCRVPSWKCCVCDKDQKLGSYVCFHQACAGRWQLLLQELCLCLHGESGVQSRSYRAQ